MVFEIIKMRAMMIGDIMYEYLLLLNDEYSCKRSTTLSSSQSNKPNTEPYKPNVIRRGEFCIIKAALKDKMKSRIYINEWK